MKQYQNDKYEHKSVCYGEKCNTKVLTFEVYKTYVLSFYYAFSTVLCMSIMQYSCLKAKSLGCMQDVTVYQQALNGTKTQCSREGMPVIATAK